MADATPLLEPSPPPARIVVAVLALVRVVLVAARALPYLGYADVWVLTAGLAAKVVADRAWGEGSAPSVFLEAVTDATYKVFLCGAFLLLALGAVLLCGTCLASLLESLSGSDSELKKDALGAPRHDSTPVPRTAVLGWVASVPFILLFFTGSLMEVMRSSPVEGSISRGEMIGSVIVDVGVFGANAITCFVIIPALALDTWRDDQLDRKGGLTV